MEPNHDLSELARCLRHLGVATADASVDPSVNGYPVVLSTQEGDLVLDVASPPLIGGMDPALVGLAVLDPLGRCRAAWGLAERIPEVRARPDSRSEALRDVLRQAHFGRPGSLLVEDVRYHIAPLLSGSSPETLVLVTDAREERALRDRAELDERAATVLRVMGRAMASEGDVARLCASVVHELAVSADLAAALVWTTEGERVLRLRACRGIAPAGQDRLRRLRGTNGKETLAEQAAYTREVQAVAQVSASALTAGYEARYSLLSPGGAIALPLTGGDALYGVLEAIGRERDARFGECHPLFETVAEHLALAIRAANLLETTQRLATHDPLTGIANHRCLHDFLERRLAEAVRESRPLGVVMVDVDHFRAFNEEEGHAVGDAVLKTVARALRESVRRSDLAARYGGEEFTLVLPGQNLEDAHRVAERVRRTVEALDLSPQTRLSRTVTVSLGCAGYPETATEVAQLLRAADDALYAAKRQGRNRTFVYEGPYQDRQGAGEGETPRRRAA